MIQHLGATIIAECDDFWRVYAHFVPCGIALTSSFHHRICSPTDQHTISPAHARIYLASSRNHCSNIDLSSFIHLHSKPCRNHVFYRTRLPLHVHNYFHPYCPITVYRFQPSPRSPTIVFSSRTVLRSRPLNFRFALARLLFDL